MFWGAGVWNLTAKQSDKLDVTQKKMLKKMFKIPCVPRSDVETRQRDINFWTTSYMKKFDIPKWSDVANNEVFVWAGKIQRQASQNTNRLTGKVMNFKSLAEQFTFARKNQGRQGHAHRFHPWRFESKVFNFFFKKNLDWREEALDCHQWMDHYVEWAKWMHSPSSARSLNCSLMC